MDKFLQQVQQTIETWEMLSVGQRVLVALSGGADSVALLCALQMLGYSVQACHLHHGLRGQEAERDVLFCQALCAKKQIPLHIQRKNIAEYARKTGQSVETAARQVRYHLFEQLSDGNPIATAHTAGDTLETMLFHLARGTGMTGLCGIPPVRGNVIRPLIGCTREEIERFLQRIGQDFVIDSTNLQDDYTRNKIRHHVVPVLRQINPKVESAAAGLAQRLRQEDDFLQQTANQVLLQIKQGENWLIAPLKAAHPAIRQRVLREICRQSGVKMQEFSAKHMKALEHLLQTDHPSAKISLPANKVAQRSYNLFQIQENTKKYGENRKIERVKVPKVLNVWQEQTHIWIRRCKKNQVFYKTFNTFRLDCDTIDISSLVLRTRQTGDKIRLTEQGGSRTLKKLFIDKKIPITKRDTLAVLADAYGVVAVESLGVDISRKPKGEFVLEIQFKG